MPVKKTIRNSTKVSLPIKSKNISNIIYTESSKILLERIATNVNQENAFFVCDLASVLDQYNRWVNNLSQFTPFYAIKCNPDPVILKLLSNLGSGFDCASKGEIEQILKLGVDPNRIIYANPCKPPSHIKYAQEKGVLMMTFDNIDELYKIKKYHPKSKLILRILADDSKSICRFGVKFGANPKLVLDLLKEAKILNLDIIGVSFHVGSGCYDPMSYDDAIKRAYNVFVEAKEFGYTLKLLDIGGGFPSIKKKTNDEKSIIFEDIAFVVNQAVEKYFPNWREENMVFLGEPGRYFVSGAFTLSTMITSRRHVKDSLPNAISPIDSYMYYINDGVYGSFNCLIYDHAIVQPNILFKANKGEECYESSIWGPTCDSMDLILKNTSLPKLEVGDWLYFNDMGAYTICAASEFNGFNISKVTYTDTSSGSVVKSLMNQL